MVLNMDGDIVINLGQLCKESVMFSLERVICTEGSGEVRKHRFTP